MKLEAFLEGEVDAEIWPSQNLCQCPGGCQLPPHGDLKAGEEGIPPGPFLLTSGPGHASLRPADLSQSLGPTGTTASSTVWPELGHPALSCPFSGPEDSLPGSSQPVTD